MSCCYFLLTIPEDGDPRFRRDPFDSPEAAKRGRDADQFSKYQGRRHALRDALGRDTGMDRSYRALLWEAYWEQVPLPESRNRHRREAAYAARMALHFLQEARESLALGKYDEARAYLSDTEGELSVLLPEENG